MKPPQYTDLFYFIDVPRNQLIIPLAQSFKFRVL